MTWSDYLKNTKNIKARPLLVEALQYTQGDKVLDLGAGALNDAKFLKGKGYKVTAVDSNQEIETMANESGILFVHSTFENFSFAEKYDLISAQYALPFIRPTYFRNVLEEIKKSLNTKGVFTGQFFGPEDDWATNKEMTFNTGAEVRTFFDGFEILKFEEEKSDKATAAGHIKHWHVFHVIARKR